MMLYKSFFKSVKKARPVILVSLCFFLVLSCSQPPKTREYRLEGQTMGTTYHITAIVGPKVSVAENTLQMNVDKALEDINQVMSTYIQDSELSMLNKAPVNMPVIVSQGLFDVLALSANISRLSDSAFDVTVGPLVNLWGFGPNKSDAKPEQSAIDAAMAQVGYQHVVLDKTKRQVTKVADVYIDLSAVAKGYGADLIAELLQRTGIENYMVEVGGEIAMAGHNASGRGWTIGVEQPTLAHSGAVMGVTIDKGGVATSGDYRNYYEVDGVRYSHTIDPSTGYPITHTLASVTVVADSSAKADALATAINVLGPEKGYDLAVRENLAVFLIIRRKDGYETKASPEFDKYRVKL